MRGFFEKEPLDLEGLVKVPFGLGPEGPRVSSCGSAGRPGRAFGGSAGRLERFLGEGAGEASEQGSGGL